MKRFKYSDEMKAFFVTHYPNHSVDELALKFNAKFGTDKTAKQIKSALSNFKIVSGRSAGDTMRVVLDCLRKNKALG